MENEKEQAKNTTIPDAPLEHLIDPHANVFAIGGPTASVFSDWPHLIASKTADSFRYVVTGGEILCRLYAPDETGVQVLTINRALMGDVEVTETDRNTPPKIGRRERWGTHLNEPRTPPRKPSGYRLTRTPNAR